MIDLFSYGTLQQRDVQLANYGRRLSGSPDTLRGYRLETVAIDDPEIVRLSGKPVHWIACHSGNPADCIAGTRFEISAAELAATDAYETGAYARVEVLLDSGFRAWCYIRPA